MPRPEPLSHQTAPSLFAESGYVLFDAQSKIPAAIRLELDVRMSMKGFDAFHARVAFKRPESQTHRVVGIARRFAEPRSQLEVRKQTLDRVVLYECMAMCFWG